MIMDELVLTKWNNDITRYQSLGYVYTGYKTDLWVKPQDLPASSTVKVSVLCSHCGNTSNIQYNNYVSNISRNDGVYRCRTCRYTQSKRTIEEVRQAFADRDLFLVTSEYPGSNGTLNYLCYHHMYHPEGFRSTTWNRFISQGSGCPQCFVDWCSTNYFGANNPNYRGGKNTLVGYLRTSNPKWRKYILAKYDHRCIISGAQAEHVHHTQSYTSKVRSIVEVNLGIKWHRLLEKYTQDEISQIRKLLYAWEYTDGVGVPLTKELHEEFHNTYSNLNFTFDNFKTFFQLKTNLPYSGE